jgi:carbonic anhydrase
MKGIFAALLLTIGLNSSLIARPYGGISPENAWSLLRDGNDRYARSLEANPHTSRERRNEVIESQSPFAVVLSCSDSRVPIERVMDAGVGDIYSVRVAGNSSADPLVMGSIEYGVLRAGANLIAVIGHESCEAVEASVAEEKVPGSSMDAIAESVKAAADNAKDALHALSGRDLIAEAVERNVLNSMKTILTGSPKIAELVREGKVKIVGGVYSLHTGHINWLGEHPSQEMILEEKAK